MAVPQHLWLLAHAQVFSGCGSASVADINKVEIINMADTPQSYCVKALRLLR
jgi:hypothetical protein